MRQFQPTNRSIYLAGPMGYNTPEEIFTWRDQACKDLQAENFTPLDPTRGFFRDIINIMVKDNPGCTCEELLDKYIEPTMSTLDKVVPELSKKVIMRRDHQDLQSSGAILAYFDGSISPGTFMEMGMAAAYDIPVIALCTSKQVYAALSRHPMLSDVVIAWTIKTDTSRLVYSGISILKELYYSNEKN